MENEELIRKSIGRRMAKYREDNKINQTDFAEMLGASRSTISLIEAGDAMPGIEQIVNLSKILGCSVDSLLKIESNRYAVVDTSVILKRPTALNLISEQVDMIFIPDTVVRELNNLKDRGSGSMKNRAALCLNAVIAMKEAGKGNILRDETEGGNNDDAIFGAAVKLASEHPADKVFMISNDKDFKLKDIGKLKNIEVCSMKDFELKFHKNDTYNYKASQIFFDAVKKRDIEKAREQAARYNIDVNYHDAVSGQTPLIQAVVNKDMKMIKYILSLPTLNIDATDTKLHGLPAISQAIQTCRNRQTGEIRTDIIQLLIEHGANVNAPSRNNKNSYNTPLMIASWHGLLPVVKLLVENGACLNQEDQGNGFTPLIKAAFNNHPEVAEYLLQHHADPTICSYEEKTALDYAFEKNAGKRYQTVIDILKKYQNREE